MTENPSECAPTYTSDNAIGSSPALRRTLGTGAIVFMVLAAAAPLTATTGVVPLTILFSENPAAAVYFVITTVILTMFAIAYTALSKYVTDAGAFYAYITAGLGEKIGNAAATLAVGAYSLTVLALTAYAGPFASDLVASFTGWKNSPWWLWSLVFLAILATFAYREVQLNSRVLSVVLIAETCAIVLLGIAILVHGGADGIHLSPLSPVQAINHGSPAMGIMWAALCFIGFEATAVYRQESKDPDRTIPRATYLAILSIGVLYTFAAWCIVLGLGQDRALEMIGADPAGVIFTLASTYVSPLFANVMVVLLLGSIFACALSFHNVSSRYQLAMSQGGVLPSFLGRVHPKHSVPSTASATLSLFVFVALIAVMALNLNPAEQVFAPLVGILGFAVIILMCLATVSALVYFHRNRGADRLTLFTTVIAPALALLALLSVLVLSFTNIGVITGSSLGTTVVVSLLAILPLIGFLATAVKRRMRN